MILIKPNYFKNKRFFNLFLIIIIISFIFTFNLVVIEGVQQGFASYIGQSKDVVVIYNRASSTPFTSYIPYYLSYNLSKIPGIIAVSPEILTPVLINNKPIFIRGIIPSYFIQVSNFKLLEGNNLSNDLPLAAIIGIQAEKILNIRIGQWITIVSAILGSVADLKVVGIFETQSPMDSEIFVNLNIAQTIISIGKDFVNFIRVKINPLQTNEYKIYSDLGIIVESSKTNQNNLPISSISPSVTNFNPNLLGISSPNDAINYYLSKYGFNFSSLIVVASILLLIMSVGIFVTSRVIISDNRKEIDLIKAIGVTEKKLLST